MTILTTHFTLAEATRSETAQRLSLSNSPGRVQFCAIKHTAQQMERVREVLGSHPIHVSSWYRNERVNKAVGGVPSSAHISGYAVDFNCPKFGTVTDICSAIVASDLKFDQLIWEYGRWVHISFAPEQRGQILHIKKGIGYQQGLPT